MSWSRSRSTGPIRTGCRRRSISRPATSCRCRSARVARRRQWSGRTIRRPISGSTTGSRMSRRSSTMPPLRPELRSFVDWVANYTVSSRGMVLRMCLRMGEHLGAERERVGVRLAGAGAATHDERARARARTPRRRHGARQERRRARSGRLNRRDRRADRRRHAGNRGAAAGAGRGKTRSRFHAAGIHRRTARRRGGAEGSGRQRRLHGVADRRRHRLRQDRSLF